MKEQRSHLLSEKVILIYCNFLQHKKVFIQEIPLNWLRDFYIDRIPTFFIEIRTMVATMISWKNFCNPTLVFEVRAEK